MTASETRSLVEAAFDSAFYRQTYADIGPGPDPLDHFLTIGWVQGRDPSAEFSVLGYLLRNSDVLSRHLNPLVHYVRAGRQEGRECYPSSADHSVYLPSDADALDLLPVWFDEEYYLAMNPELVGCPSPLSQFLVLGWAEGRDPCAAFSTHKYLWKYNDAWLAGINPLIHFLTVGRKAGCDALPAEGSRFSIQRDLTKAEWLDRVKAEFDADFYYHHYPAARTAGDLFEHYRSVGWKEGYDPNANFSVSQYLAHHRDVQKSGHDPFYHYIRYGLVEGRAAFPSKAEPVPVEETAASAERTEEQRRIEAEFDRDYYLTTYPELAAVRDPFQHYMTMGWKEGRNPSPDFNTKYYLSKESDIREAGVNPFRHFILHGRHEGRRGMAFVPTLAGQTAFPKLTVIVPNYNHAAFLPERLQSIVRQNYPNMELLLLDDCSSDNSRDILAAFAASYEGDCKLVFNETNSGNVFSQWQKGLGLATGELIWICESDDTCDADFLKQIVYLFQDPSVRIAFGDIQFIDGDGAHAEGMTGLRESAARGIWRDVNIMPAAEWFTGPLAIRNVISNVGGAVFRKPDLPDSVWQEVRSYSVAGDWYLYAVMAGGGQIAYAPDAKAFFRQHASNTSVTAFDKPSFYQELGRFHAFLRRRWSVPAHVTLTFYGTVIELFERSRLVGACNLSSLISLDNLINTSRASVHIAVSFLNFDVGGGEIFPIEVLNVLHRRGFIVSAVVKSDQSDNKFVRSWLHSDIPVYVSDMVPFSGPVLAHNAAFDIIHSHNIWSEFYFLTGAAQRRFKYVATLHGSYEVSEVQPGQVADFYDKVVWAYIAERNLEKFRQFGFDTSGCRLIPNGMGRRLSPHPVTRAELDIEAGSLVFLFAARSHPDKGWHQVATAFDQLCRETSRHITLVMAGDGPEPQAIKTRFARNRNIKVLGFRSDVDDLLTLSDYTIVPTRFAGESMPLIIIQSILAGVPIIASNIGHIEDMLNSTSGPIGMTIEPSADDTTFIATLLAAMSEAVAGQLVFTQQAFATAATRFSIETCVDKYEVLYGLAASPAPVATPIWLADRRAACNRAALRNPTDLTDEEWDVVRHIVPASKATPAPVLRNVVNGLLYKFTTGCEWREVPHDYAASHVLRGTFEEWHLDGRLDRLEQALHETCPSLTPPPNAAEVSAAGNEPPKVVRLRTRGRRPANGGEPFEEAAAPAGRRSRAVRSTPETSPR